MDFSILRPADMYQAHSDNASRPVFSDPKQRDLQDCRENSIDHHMQHYKAIAGYTEAVRITQQDKAVHDRRGKYVQYAKYRQRLYKRVLTKRYD